MKRWFALYLLFIASAIAPSALADTLTGTVFVVIDGDTVLFRPDHYRNRSRAFLKIRLADIDAPENDQPYGDAATHALTTLVLNQRVEIDTVAIDKYGRTIARIRKGTMQVDAELVRRGFAWAYDSTRASTLKGTRARSGSEYPQEASRSFRAYTRSRRDSALMDAQREARSARRGLWQGAAPTPPWTWRRAQSAPAY
ncbi:MAG: thermonuclease family protein [Thiobacillus sp.]